MSFVRKCRTLRKHELIDRLPAIYAVVGSRQITNYKYVKGILNRYNIKKIVSGGAIGVNQLAARYAKENDIPLIEIKPNYEKHGKVAPLLRNKEIVKMADKTIAIWDGHSRGTKHTIDYTDTLKKECYVFLVAKMNQGG